MLVELAEFEEEAVALMHIPTTKAKQQIPGIPRPLERLCFWLPLFVLVTASGCHSEEARPALRLAVNPWPGYSFIYLAEEQGYFEEEGLSVQLVELASLADSRRIFEQGQADILCCTLVEVLLMNDVDERDPVKVVSAVDYSNGSDMLLGRWSVARLESIRGCRVGVEPESVDGLALYLALQSVGLTIEDVELVPLAQSEMVEAMQQERVDAVQTYPPISDLILRQEGVHRLWDSSQAPATILDVLAARQSLLDVRVEEMHELLRAYTRAQRFYVDQPADATRILARRCGLTEEALHRSLQGVHVLIPEEAAACGICDPATGETLTDSVARGLMAIGMLKRLPLHAAFDTRFQALSSP